MRVITTLALAAGLIALAGCSEAAEEPAAENMDVNLDLPADDLNATDANLANDGVNTNLGNDANAVADNGAVDTTY